MDYKKCILCDSENLSKYLTFNSDSRSSKYSMGKLQKLSGQLMKCDNCSFVFLNPRMDESDLSGMYKAGVESGYLKQQHNRTYHFRNVIALMVKNLNDDKIKILDIGCADGLLLEESKKLGWETLGIEPIKALADYGKETYGIEILNGVFSDFKLKENYFHVVTLLDVIEHLENPKVLLSGVKDIIKPGGLLVASFPDVDSLSAKLFRKKWWMYMKGHINFFNSRSLSLMLNEIDFEAILINNYSKTLDIKYLIDLCENAYPSLHRFAHAVFKYMPDFKLKYLAGEKILIAKKR